MRIREEIRRPVRRDRRGVRDQRRRHREILRQQKEHVQRIKKLRCPTIGLRPKEKDGFPNFKINGMTREEAREYRMALVAFIAHERSLQETSDDFSESEEESSGRKIDLRARKFDKKSRKKSPTMNKGVSEKWKTFRKLRNPPGEERSVKRKGRRVEKIRDKREEDKTAEVSPEAGKLPNMAECRVLLRRLSSELAEGLIARYGNVWKRPGSGRFQRSPTQLAVSAGEMEATEEDDYILDEENILGFFSGNHNSSIHVNSPSHPSLSDEEENSSTPPILTLALPSQGCRENSRSPPVLSPFDTEHSEGGHSSIEKDKSMAVDNYCESHPPQHRFALGKVYGYLNLVCIDWNHSAKPSEVVAENLSDWQLEMLVTAMESLLETSLERFYNPASMLCQRAADLHVSDSICQVSEPIR